ncbi:hypothetical protein I656_00364 [Geobacillus sp. WSUCF1]|nr:hypothetical protein I656_00364 [Geobacillus sp. WSUCF1]
MGMNKITIYNEGRLIAMRRSRKMTLQELISENKRQLLNDREALEKIEKKLEERMLKKAE